MLDLVRVQTIRWEDGGTELVGDHIFLRKGNENHEFDAGILCMREIYQQLRGLSMLVIRCHT
jgi:hypothetical protein